MPIPPPTATDPTPNNALFPPVFRLPRRAGSRALSAGLVEHSRAVPGPLAHSFLQLPAAQNHAIGSHRIATVGKGLQNGHAA